MKTIKLKKYPVSKNIPNAETKKALDESIAGKSEYSSYTTFEDLMKELKS